MAKVFFSYSHRDEDLRNELEIHLSTLKHQAIIEPWHDRRIDAGQEFSQEISEYLDEADIILLLVSPYFLGSQYCYDVEMKRALEKHKTKEAVLIPVILEPCDWEFSLFGGIMATPTDGKPVTKHSNIHDAFLDITNSIRKVSLKINDKTVAQQKNTVKNQPEITIKSIQPRSSNLRIKKQFTDRDKDEFFEETFEYIAKFFEGSLDELEKRNEGIAGKFKKIDANHFTASIYKNDKNISSCKIWISSGMFGKHSISFSYNANSSDSSMNDSLSMGYNDNNLYFSSMGMYGSQSADSELTQEGGAEYFWNNLISPLQR